MKTPDEKLDALLNDAARDPRPGEWIQRAARGMEARVLQRIAQPESWSEALFGLSSWRPLAASVVALLLVCAWTGRSVTDVFDDDWLTVQTAAESEPAADDFDF